VAAVRVSVAAVRMLVRALLPHPVFDPPTALALLAYHQRRQAAAYRSHRKRRLKRLDELIDPTTTSYTPER
jgi:hypothetical protein